jgi:hypothetical protein
MFYILYSFVTYLLTFPRYVPFQVLNQLSSWMSCYCRTPHLTFYFQTNSNNMTNVWTVVMCVHVWVSVSVHVHTSCHAKYKAQWKYAWISVTTVWSHGRTSCVVASLAPVSAALFPEIPAWPGTKQKTTYQPFSQRRDSWTDELFMTLTESEQGNKCVRAWCLMS